MPVFTLKIEDYSPVLQYSAQWLTGGSAGGGDAARVNYSSSSFTATNTQGSFMSFTYSGSGIQIYGAKRSNHGNYRVVVDNGTTYSYDSIGFSSNDTFQQSLFNYSTLTENRHNVTITNEEDLYLDIDFITLQSTIGNENEKLTTTNFDDGHPAFTYFPPSSWTTNPPNQSDYYDTSGHMTSDINAHVEFLFEVRDAVTLYGPVHPDGASYLAVLDGRASFQPYTTNKITPQSQVIMYQAFHLGPGQHNLTISYAPSPLDASQNQPFFAIDYATVYTTASIQNSGGDGVSSRSRLSGGVLAGLVVAGVALLLIIVLGLVCLYNYRRHGYTNWRNLLIPQRQLHQTPRPFDPLAMTNTPFLNTPNSSGGITPYLPTIRWPTVPASTQSKSSVPSRHRFGDSTNMTGSSNATQGVRSSENPVLDRSDDRTTVHQEEILRGSSPPPEYSD
ncbi:hypothetical protein BDQ17DRAFT_1425934 [Cyathus striatus]|nr:hypothetical protein BDQ17DRAFT_1425934 [Cyathus striatus]